MVRFIRFGLFTFAFLNFFILLFSPSLAQNSERRRVTGPDRACLQCHKEDKEKMLGIHSTSISPLTQDTITCINCHGKTASDHREGVLDTMRFGKTKPFPIDQQNGVCFSCHDPKEMREAFWAHDVHASREPCSSCHQVHPQKDPMKGITTSERIKLCVDCHTDLRKEKAAAKGTP